MTDQVAVATMGQISDAVREVVREELATMIGKDARDVLPAKEMALYLGVSRPTLIGWTNREQDPAPCHYLSDREPRFLLSEMIPWVARQPKRQRKP